MINGEDRNSKFEDIEMLVDEISEDSEQSVDKLDEEVLPPVTPFGYSQRGVLFEVNPNLFEITYAINPDIYSKKKLEKILGVYCGSMDPPTNNIVYKEEVGGFRVADRIESENKLIINYREDANAMVSYIHIAWMILLNKVIEHKNIINYHDYSANVYYWTYDLGNIEFAAAFMGVSPLGDIHDQLFRSRPGDGNPYIRVEYNVNSMSFGHAVKTKIKDLLKNG